MVTVEVLCHALEQSVNCLTRFDVSNTVDSGRHSIATDARAKCMQDRVAWVRYISAICEADMNSRFTSVPAATM